MTHNDLKEAINDLAVGQHVQINDRDSPLEITGTDPTGTVTEVELEGNNTTYTLVDGINSPVSRHPVGAPQLTSAGGGVNEKVVELDVVEPDDADESEDDGDDD